MYELPVTEYERVRSIFQPLCSHLSVQNILNGHTGQKIYVDDLNHPQSALTNNKYRFYLVGDSQQLEFNRALRSHFREIIVPQALEADQAIYTMTYSGAGWRPVIETLIASQPPALSMRQYYVCKQLNRDWHALLPEGFSLRMVDHDLLEETDLENREELLEEMCSERASVGEFLNNSFGVCLLFGRTLAGWCLSEYNLGQACEIGIATQPAFRRRGLGTLMTLAFVEYAFANGYTKIGWDCWKTNLPSVQTALAAGFEFAEEYPCFMGCFNPVFNLALNGDFAFDQAKYAEALSWHEQAFQQGEQRGWPYWEAGCAAAHLEQIPLAFRYLNTAIEHGFANPAAFIDSSHLECLKLQPEWQILVAHLEAAGK